MHTPPFSWATLLLTRDGRVSEDKATPLVHAPNQVLGSNAKRQVAGLCQKVALLHDHICIAWAGSQIHAIGFAEHIRSFVVGKKEIHYEELRAHIAAYPRSDLEGHIDFIVHSWHGAGWGYFSNLTPFELEPIENIRVSGTGTQHFLEQICTVSKAPIVGDVDRYNDLAMRALAYAGMASAQQFFAGIGIADAWGGGFEVVVFKDGHLEKIGPICWLYWTCNQVDETTYSLLLHQSFMYQYYRGDTVFFWIDENADGTNKLHAIDPPFRTARVSLDPPKAIATSTLVSLFRLTQANGEVWDGFFVDRKGPGEELGVQITKTVGNVSAAVRPDFVRKLLGTMPLRGGAMVEIDLWGNKISARPF